MHFLGRLTKTVLGRVPIYCETDNGMHDGRASRYFNRHGGGVNIYQFLVNHAGALVLTFDRKAVGVLQMLIIRGYVLHVKHFGA